MAPNDTSQAQSIVADLDSITPRPLNKTFRLLRRKFDNSSYAISAFTAGLVALDLESFFETFIAAVALREAAPGRAVSAERRSKGKKPVHFKALVPIVST